MRTTDPDAITLGSSVIARLALAIFDVIAASLGSSSCSAVCPWGFEGCWRVLNGSASHQSLRHSTHNSMANLECDYNVPTVVSLKRKRGHQQSYIQETSRERSRGCRRVEKGTRCCRNGPQTSQSFTRSCAHRRTLYVAWERSKKGAELQYSLIPWGCFEMTSDRMGGSSQGQAMCYRWTVWSTCIRGRAGLS